MINIWVPFPAPSSLESRVAEHYALATWAPNAVITWKSPSYPRPMGSSPNTVFPRVEFRCANEDNAITPSPFATGSVTLTPGPAPPGSPQAPSQVTSVSVAVQEVGVADDGTKKQKLLVSYTAPSGWDADYITAYAGRRWARKQHFVECGGWGRPAGRASTEAGLGVYMWVVRPAYLRWGRIYLVSSKDNYAVFLNSSTVVVPRAHFPRARLRSRRHFR